jgi:hypothetical protein
VTLYRFLFAPVLLAVAVLTSGPRRPPPPTATRPAVAEPAPSSGVSASHGPARALRPRSHPATVP